MFSIIIPLYNKSAYIEKAIDSVLGQTLNEFELIVVNDGSTDDGLEKVLHYTDNRIRLINQQNSGVSTARNTGVKAAKYDYIAFLDADDWWEPTYLEEMKKLIEDFPEAGIYGSGYFLVKNGQKRIAPIGVKTNFKKGFINYCQVYANTLCMPLWTGATIIKKSVFSSETGFKPNLRLGEDFDLWIRVALKHPVAFLNKPLANYNQDIDLSNRAVGSRLYLPEQHMLFTDYSKMHENIDFRFLFERLAVYGLLSYYLAKKNELEVKTILSGIHWENHAFKYYLYYRLFPKTIVRLWIRCMSAGSKVKKMILCNEN